METSRWFQGPPNKNYRGNIQKNQQAARWYWENFQNTKPAGFNMATECKETEPSSMGRWTRNCGMTAEETTEALRPDRTHSQIVWLLDNDERVKKTKLHGLSPQANYTDRATALSAKWLPTFADRGCHVVSVTDPYGRILGFLDRSSYFSIK
jgi:hypothetical protein